MPENGLAISVVVPTFRRADALDRCLAALERQDRAPDRVVVVVRDEDQESRACCERHTGALPLEIATVDRPGQVAALNAGLARVPDGVVAFTDDDCEPYPDWVARLHERFVTDPATGAVGGRDVLHDDGRIQAPTAEQVGTILPFGRRVGNHHAIAPAQDVDFLKGANMAYRRSLLAGFDERLRGQGAQVHNDLKASLTVSASGHRVVWDPEVRVDHRPEPRPVDDRVNRSLSAVRDQHHNETYTLLDVLPAGRAWALVAYSLLVGSTTAPGPVLLPRAIARLGLRVATRVAAAATAGRVAGIVTACRTRRGQ